MQTDKPDKDAEYRAYVVARAERLRRYAYLCCGDWHRAEDAAQTALVRLYTAWGRARKDSLDAYTRRIVTNILIDEHRRGWFRRERVSDELPERVAAPAPGPETRLDLAEALQHLSKRQRAAVVLRYWEDLPIEQTARILGCSTGAVKSLTLRGLHALRELLTDEVLDANQGVQA